MANVKVAVRVRPPNAREAADGGRLAVQVEEKFVRIQNVKLDGRTEHTVDSREKLLEFCFDYCYWSVHPEDPHYASQEEVFQDLGESVLAGAHEGYNVCLFAYGQTGSGKTYTMMGTPDSIGLTPRICQGLFWSDDALPDGQNSSRVEISFLEIYNERVRDLLRVGEQKKRASLRVREHPEKGPYVQDLSQHVVSDSKQAMVLLEEGIANRITAATHNHDASSRSHAIFTIQYTQAILENNRPSETVSKINLVDLAGSERADHNYCRDRLTEGSNINKSLVTLGIVISALAQNSQMSSSCHSINSMASEGDKSTAGSHSSSLSRGGGGGRRHYFIPYRDSVLTWLLKDSLGGNSKTIMIATVSPSASSYNETLSTLRYAAHARNIVNKPRVNEDANVRLIRELREEIDRLKSMLLTYEMRNHSPSLSDERDGALSDIVLQNELKVEQLMKDWSESWIDQNYLLQQYKVDINSMQPHLISLDRDGLCTGIVVYNLPEGITRIGPRGRAEEPHIVLQGGASCEIENHEGVVTLRPLPDAVCLLNEREINEPCRLAQGAVITLGGVHKFLLNHPTEAALHQEQTRAVKSNMPCTFIDLCIKGGAHCGEKTMLQGEAPHCTSLNDQTAARQRVEKQQRYVESLLQDMHCEQRKAEKELEREQALLQQQHSELQTWIDQEKERLLMVERRATQELGVQTDLVSPQVLDQLSSFVSADQNSPTGIFPSQLDRERKKVVNQELIKHHALCRAASRIHRSRLQFQLKRIANKRCMLEAKRELQSLEKALPSGLEGLDSADFGSKCPGDSFASRRHSFTSDLRSRRHCSVSRHAVKRNQHATSATSICSRTWVSDDCLPRERTQSCSGSLFSGQSCQDEKRLCAKDETPLPFPKCPERKPLLPNRDLTFKNWSNVVTSRSPVSSATQKTGQENFLSTTKEERVCHTASTGSVATACDASAVSSGQGTTEELHGLVTPKKIFSKGFRQPSFSNEERGPKALRRVMKKMHWRQQRGLSLDRKRPGSKRGVNSAVSCDDLDQTCLLQGFSQRRCHSADALMSQTKRWVETQPELTGWVEEEKEVKWDEERSDCDSLFSLDSLSSAYAAVLADQLKSKEDAWGCGAESEDSNMSKDSLTVVSRQKCTSMKKLSKALHPLLVQESPRVSPREKGDHGASAALDLRTRNSDSGTVRTPEKKSETQSSIFSNIYIHPLNVDRETLHDPAVGPQMSLSDSLGQLKHRDVAFSSKVFTSVPATALALNNKSSAQVHCSDKAKGPSTTLGESLLETDNHSSTGEAKFPVVRYESPHERPTIVRNPSQSPEEEIGKLPVETSICSAAHSCTNSSELIYDSGCCMKLPTDDHNPDDSAEDVDQYELPDDISLSRDETLDETLPPGIVDSGSIEERQQALMGNALIL
ncbi:stAR-related lipid transfer protein 9-like [Synchiropus picturatus]